MLFVMIAFVAAAALIAVAIHFGPHGSVVSGVIGLVLGLVIAWSAQAAISTVGAWALGAGVVVVGLALAGIGLRGVRGLNTRAAIAAPSPLARLLGEEAVVERDLSPIGAIHVHGESWTATTETGESVPAGTHVFITRVDGLRVWVVPAARPEDRQRHSA
ncbi:protein of unknown function DUF107 [Acidimicrobium ferrooxidans DSM 10331]|uniref:NfeD-like C-terminal domain-containing protein n=1 Tax=Acidimicrobium ferrooxidans (strain DSM 10331 / JCM 15462 / NBRC 103882 / ICP) TaxID=525909 RepID=C7M0I5_ACIFD|nr:NfeD family protein [Acidimicrobium ferrooxidans]ACU54493.1 protein of unknown function DUF107 [Acidimicrobium ferrooxidans DSM 10331]